MSNKIKALIISLVAVAAAIFAGVGVAININSDGKVTITFSDEAKPAIVELEQGEAKAVDVPTVESVDSQVITSKDECPTESEECAKGSYLPSIDITSPATFYNSVIDQCIDFDGAWGSQCYDEMAYFHYVYTGRWLSTGGTGAAYGIWDARDYNNSGNEYELIYDANDIKPGTWVIFHNGVYGHVGMAIGYPNNGYVTLLGTNQGGHSCPGGGAAANVINISLSSFSGGFMPRAWIIPEPEPTPEPVAGGVSYTYVQGDYFSAVIKKLGLATDKGLWGADGDVNYYNAQLYKAGILDYYAGNYWNNIPVGTEIHLEAR